jgi:hypothetical protein
MPSGGIRLNGKTLILHPLCAQGRSPSSRYPVVSAARAQVPVLPRGWRQGRRCIKATAIAPVCTPGFSPRGAPRLTRTEKLRNPGRGRIHRIAGRRETGLRP